MVTASDLQHIRNEFRRDWSSGAVLFVLPGIRKARQDSRYAPSRCHLASADGDEKLHQIVVHGL